MFSSNLFEKLFQLLICPDHFSLNYIHICWLINAALGLIVDREALVALLVGDQENIEAVFRNMPEQPVPMVHVYAGRKGAHVDVGVTLSVQHGMLLISECDQPFHVPVVIRFDVGTAGFLRVDQDVQYLEGVVLTLDEHVPGHFNLTAFDKGPHFIASLGCDVNDRAFFSFDRRGFIQWDRQALCLYQFYR